jgi:hypothetical protein
MLFSPPAIFIFCGWYLQDLLADLTRFSGMPIDLSSAWGIEDTLFIEVVI